MDRERKRRKSDYRSYSDEEDMGYSESDYKKYNDSRQKNDNDFNFYGVNYTGKGAEEVKNFLKNYYTVNDDRYNDRYNDRRDNDKDSYHSNNHNSYDNDNSWNKTNNEDYNHNNNSNNKDHDSWNNKNDSNRNSNSNNNNNSNHNNNSHIVHINNNFNNDTQHNNYNPFNVNKYTNLPNKSVHNSFNNPLPSNPRKGGLRVNYSRILFLSNVPDDITSNDIYQLLYKYQCDNNIDLQVLHEIQWLYSNGIFKRKGFVTFMNYQAANHALALNGSIIKGKKVIFEMEKITAERTRNLYLLNLPDFNNANNKAIRDIFSRLGEFLSFNWIQDKRVFCGYEGYILIKFKNEVFVNDAEQLEDSVVDGKEIKLGYYWLSNRPNEMR